VDPAQTKKENGVKNTGPLKGNFPRVVTGTYNDSGGTSRGYKEVRISTVRKHSFAKGAFLPYTMPLKVEGTFKGYSFPVQFALTYSASYWFTQNHYYSQSLPSSKSAYKQSMFCTLFPLLTASLRAPVLPPSLPPSLYICTFFSHWLTLLP
jgi:hypothetical protein